MLERAAVNFSPCVTIAGTLECSRPGETSETVSLMQTVKAQSSENGKVAQFRRVFEKEACYFRDVIFMMFIYARIFDEARSQT